MIQELELCPLFVDEGAQDRQVTTAYCGDLLSDVLANVEPDAVWFTIQSHMNIIAIAQLRDVACIVLVNGAAPDPQTVAKAKTQGVNLCGSEKTSAELCMKLAGRL